MEYARRWIENEARNVSRLNFMNIIFQQMSPTIEPRRRRRRHCSRRRN